MSDTQDPVAYGDTVEFLRDNVMSLAEAALAVFREDFPQFFHREARRRFLASPAFARALDDAALQALKRDLEGEGRAATERVLARLRDPAPWLAGVDVAESCGKQLADNPALWEVVSSIGREVEALLARHGFPRDDDGGYGVLYQEPKRFIAGHYLPSVAEKYWRRIAELREVETQQREIEADRERSELLARWNQF